MRPKTAGNTSTGDLGLNFMIGLQFAPRTIHADDRLRSRGNNF